MMVKLFTSSLHINFSTYHYRCFRQWPMLYICGLCMRCHSYVCYMCSALWVDSMVSVCSPFSTHVCVYVCVHIKKIVVFLFNPCIFCYSVCTFSLIWITAKFYPNRNRLNIWTWKIIASWWFYARNLQIYHWVCGM